MSNLKLHANGKNEHRKSLANVLAEKIKTIKANKKLSESEIKANIMKVKEEYKVKEKDSGHNLY